MSYDSKKKGLASKALEKAKGGKKVHPEYEAFASKWKSEHSISKPPSHDSWRKYYRGDSNAGKPSETTFQKH